MMNSVDVRSNVTEDNSTHTSGFFTERKADADAAYQRLALTRKTLKMYQREINNTNTVDIVGELKDLYIDLEKTMKMIILIEQQLILEGE